MSLVRFPLDGGGSFLVEVDDHNESGLQRAGLGTDAFQTAQQSLQSALANIRPAAESIIAKLRDLAEVPSEVTVEFGIKLSAEAGVLLSKAAAEGNYKITLKWTRTTPERS